MEISDLITIVNESLEAAQTELTQEGIELKSASINLATTYDTTGSTGFSFLFISTGGEININRSHSVTYTFSKPEAKPLPEMALNGDSYLQESLIGVFKKSSELYNLNNDIGNLDKSGFQVKVTFDVKKKGDGGFEFEFFNIGADISGAHSKKNAHSITLNFDDLD